MSIGTHIREMAGHTLIYGLGSVMSSALGFLLLPLYTRQLTPEQYGLLALLTWVGSLAGALFYLGASSALSRWYYEYPEGEDRRRIVSTALAMTFVGAALQVLFGFMFASVLSQLLFRNGNYAAHITVSLVSSAMTFINALFLILLRFERRSLLVVALSLASALASGLLVWQLVGPWQVMGALIGILIPQVAVTMALIWICRRSFSREMMIPQLLPMLRFGLAASAIGIAFYIMDWLDRLVIERLCSMHDVGIYSLGSRLASVIQVVFVASFAQIWQPMRMQYRDDEQSRELFKVVLTYYAMAGSLIVVCLAVFTKELLSLIGGHSGYQEAASVIPWLMGGVLVFGMINILDLGLWIRHRVHWHIITFLAAIALNLTLNMLLIPRWGIDAAAWSKIATYTALAICTAALSFRLFPIAYEYLRVLKVLGLAGACIWVGLSAGSAGMLAEIAFKLICVTIYGLATWYLILNLQERASAIAFLHRRLHAAV